MGPPGALYLLPHLQSLPLQLLLHVHLLPHLELLSHLNPQPLLSSGDVQGNWAYPMTQHQGPGAGRQHPKGPSCLVFVGGLKLQLKNSANSTKAIFHPSSFLKTLPSTQYLHRGPRAECMASLNSWSSQLSGMPRRSIECSAFTPIHLHQFPQCHGPDLGGGYTMRQRSKDSQFVHYSL